MHERKVIVAIAENKMGVLSRVMSLLRRRSFNIHSLTAAPTEHPLFSRMTISLDGNVNTEQVTKQLHKLINVTKVWELAEHEVILHESIFLKVNVSKNHRPEVLQFGEIFHAKIVDLSEKTITFQFSSTPEKIESFIELMKPFGIKELVRSGLMAIAKEKK